MACQRKRRTVKGWTTSAAPVQHMLTETRFSSMQTRSRSCNLRCNSKASESTSWRRSAAEWLLLTAQAHSAAGKRHGNPLMGAGRGRRNWATRGIWRRRTLDKLHLLPQCAPTRTYGTVQVLLKITILYRHRMQSVQVRPRRLSSTRIWCRPYTKSLTKGPAIEEQWSAEVSLDSCPCLLGPLAWQQAASWEQLLVLPQALS
mmetsp:Transcript_69238/g.166032  ORF Transcript_69238/g.166032 Transcript_69238/m.166032 type:complete len:202 (-) Transcript_69238:1759-2364(-)